jgi:hypothetical protein
LPAASITARSTHTPTQATLQVAFVAIVALACVALVTAAALVPAPPAVLPLVALVCVGLPMAATVELPGAIATLRSDARALAALRRHLAELPETAHPLDR